MKFGQLVVGPAGSGKSTYCSNMVKHGEAVGRKISVVNLDPAAEYFDYEPLVDIRELLSVTDVQEDEDLHLGPNGGLIFCMEYMIKNPSWLEEKFEDCYEDEYLLFDCPGQIELYTHLNVMKNLVEFLTSRMDFRICAVFLMDCQFAMDRAKFFSGILVSLSTLINLEIPSVSVLTKLDLLDRKEKKLLQEVLEPQLEHLLEDKRLSEQLEEVADDKKSLDEYTPSASNKASSFAALSLCLAKVIEDYSLVKFFPLEIQDEESMCDLLLMIDNTIQFGEDADVKVKDFEEPDDGREDG